MPESAAVSLDGVSKWYDDVPAIQDAALDILPGEFMILLGPSGCGKTTLLRLIAGLETPSQGIIRIGGKVVNDVDPKDRDVAMVFQSYALYPHMTVRRNIEFPLRSRHVPEGERDRLVEEVAGSLQLGKLLGRKPAQLSGGQRQRVALARAIVRRPLAFLMDEPLSNLDAQLRIEMRAELAELHAKLGITIIYVTHDQVEATTMGHRIAVIDSGRLQQVDTPQNIYKHPANSFVAGFVGNPPMNIIEAKLEAAGDAINANFQGGFFQLPPDLAALLRQKEVGSVLVGVRPQDISIAERGTLHAKVSLVESVGDAYRLICRMDGGGLVTVDAHQDAGRIRSGDMVQLAVAGDIHLFDAATGGSLSR
jgi:multiple sugar transport system ATP-binding protein